MRSELDKALVKLYREENVENKTRRTKMKKEKTLAQESAEQYEDMRENPKAWAFYYENKADRNFELNNNCNDDFDTSDPEALLDNDLDFLEGNMDDANIKYDRIGRDIFDISNY